MSVRKHDRQREAFRTRLRVRLSSFFQLEEEAAGKVCDGAMVGLVFLHNDAYEAHERNDLRRLGEIRSTLLTFAERFDFKNLALMTGGLACDNAQRRLCCLTGMEALLTGIGLAEVTLRTIVEEDD